VKPDLNWFMAVPEINPERVNKLLMSLEKAVFVLI
jgi:hypothetical protein